MVGARRRARQCIPIRWCPWYDLDRHVGSHTTRTLRRTVSVQIEGAHELDITIVAKEEFVLARAEHPHWTTRFTTFGKFLMARIVTLRNRDTLETTHPTCQTCQTRDVMRTNSERSMISKPFVQRMAILAFKKMRSYDSDGRKKSCAIAFMIPPGCERGYTYSVDAEPFRAGLPQTKSRTQEHRSLSLLVNLANDGFEYAEDAVQLVDPVRSM